MIYSREICPPPPPCNLDNANGLSCFQLVDFIDNFLEDDVLDCYPNLTPCPSENQVCFHMTDDFVFSYSFTNQNDMILGYDQVIAPMMNDIENAITIFAGADNYPCTITGEVTDIRDCSANVGTIEVTLSFIDFCSP